MNDLDQLEAEILKEEQRLSPEQQNMVDNSADANKANPIIAWVLWWFLGEFGAHRFYLHRNNALAMLIIDVTGWILSIILIGLPIILFIRIWWIIDAFSIQAWLREDYLLKKKQAIDMINSNDNSTFDGQFTAK
ncbi:TM2 domain-containing protein [Apilactobacillus micheneri]|uniref:TM2 domain-containing protein n=1 Tax=Apilactobacillus micheneri TaxID=1899430 RepID=A0A9Q8ILT9_9LACO|nr:TM2 domain-containing protein [Apilactobacillus micheneri]TPR26221.1 TM2 domain-containing protein [Apilactobacillus micheneri]TPR26975.1 TM2 domain-containing protein [Apilactobacillus micheneri]TPR27833.1 TM2 domain-containing protein [Apilactobacillus micheneri]TPR31738.1 TM2 domain-containing protein [Apilactobacillus micheneri]TPR32142.1 TM2 domain-containing protein [Apilactobacillus micheneri]